MYIHIGIQSSCSEITYQVLGATSPIAERMRKRFQELLKNKYTKEWLKDYSYQIFNTEGKYNLKLYTYDGGEMPDWDIIEKVSKEMNLMVKYVSCCSEPINSDAQMDRHLEFYKEQKEKNNGL